MSHYKAVAAIIKNTIASINEILKSPEDELHRLSVTNDLQRTHDKLLLLTGNGDLEGQLSAVLGPATTIGGKPISKQRRFTEADMVPSDDKVFKLKQDIEEALIYFGPDASAEGILANIPDLIIRGVAKKAGMQVTKDEPKELTVEFIEEVKQVLLAAGLTGKENAGGEEGGDASVGKSEEGQDLNELKSPTPETEANVEETELPKSEEKKDEPKPDTKKKSGK